jgi:hypothetical protein
MRQARNIKIKRKKGTFFGSSRKMNFRFIPAGAIAQHFVAVLVYVKIKH